MSRLEEFEATRQQMTWNHRETATTSEGNRRQTCDQLEQTEQSAATTSRQGSGSNRTDERLQRRFLSSSHDLKHVAFAHRRHEKLLLFIYDPRRTFDLISCSGDWWFIGGEQMWAAGQEPPCGWWPRAPRRLLWHATPTPKNFKCRW